MSQSNHVYNELLKSNPEQLVLNIQSLIDSTIYKFIQSNKFVQKDYDEIKQEVNEKLLVRIPKIRNQFNGRSLLTTYLITVIRNICHDIYRKKNSEPVFIDYEDVITEQKDDDVDISLIFEEEKTRLNRILELYFDERGKLIFCLKLKYRIPFTFRDMKMAIPLADIKEYELFSNKIKPYISATDSLIYDGLTVIFNKHENKNNSMDALRKWISKKINEIICMLNNNSGKYNYTEETLQILFEMCFVKDNEMVSGIIS